MTTKGTESISLAQEHPLSESWNSLKPNLCRIEVSSVEFRSSLNDYLHDVLINGKEFINETPLMDNSRSNDSSNIYRIPISAQIFEIPDQELDLILTGLPCSPMLLIKYLSRELNNVYIQSCQKDEDIINLKRKITSGLLKIPRSKNNNLSTINSQILSSTEKEESIYTYSSKLFKPGKGLLSDLLDKRKSLDLHSDCSFNLDLHNEHQNSHLNKNVDKSLKISNDCTTTSPNYDSDNASTFSYSSLISSKSNDKLEGFILDKEAENTNVTQPIPKPFHFKAITLASNLLTNSHTSGTSTLHTNSKRTSKKISEWTLGLLTRVQNVKQEPTYHLNGLPTTAEDNNDFGYEMVVQNLEEKNLDSKLCNTNSDQNLVFDSPFSPYLSTEDQFSPNNELPELCASPSENENMYLEMTPLSNSQYWSRRGSIVIASPPFTHANTYPIGKDLEQPAFVNSNCTSPTIGISSFTTQGLHTANATLPAVSKLLSQFVDTKDDSPRLDHDERWDNFMDQHAPIIELKNELNDLENENRLPHPLAPSSNSSSEKVCSKFSILSQRKNLVISRLSIEKRRELRHLARAGIPARFRAKLWFECSGGSQMNEIGYYQGLIMKSIVSSSPFKPQIELDIHRTMPNNTYFSSEGQGVEKLYRILLAYSIHNPSVGYCQSMNLIAATLLLVLPTEEEVFWTLAAIIEHVLPSEYFTSTLLVSQADQRVLKDFVSKYLPRLNRHFDMLGVDLGAITFNWFLSLFTSCAPFPLVLRIWDVFLIEGDATLFRISLAMLELNMDNLLRLNSSSSIYNYLKSIPQRIARQTPKLLKLAFCVYKSKVHIDEINILREEHVAEFRI